MDDEIATTLTLALHCRRGDPNPVNSPEGILFFVEH
jgi:hypothetical protein